MLCFVPSWVAEFRVSVAVTFLSKFWVPHRMSRGRFCIRTQSLLRVLCNSCVSSQNAISFYSLTMLTRVSFVRATHSRHSQIVPTAGTIRAVILMVHRTSPAGSSLRPGEDPIQSAWTSIPPHSHRNHSTSCSDATVSLAPVEPRHQEARVRAREVWNQNRRFTALTSSADRHKTLA